MTPFDLVAALGIVVTFVACVRAVIAVRRRAPREQVIGWFAVMLGAAVVVLAASRF